MTDDPVELVVARFLTAGVQCVSLAAGATLALRDLGRIAGSRRLIAQRTRHAASPGAAGVFFVELLTAQSRLIRVVTLLGLLGDGEIDIGSDLCTHLVAADDRRQQILYPMLEMLLDPARVFELGR